MVVRGCTYPFDTLFPLTHSRPCMPAVHGYGRMAAGEAGESMQVD